MNRNYSYEVKEIEQTRKCIFHSNAESANIHLIEVESRIVVSRLKGN
jgi:hypothetical protein